jgi:diguanylate cyclase (GGDEF)-like protein
VTPANSHRILVVDDNPDNVDLLTQYLMGLNYEVVPAYDGDEALAAAAREKIDLVLLDVMMPRISGFEVCRRLKASDATTFTPVVLVTVRDDTQSKLEGFAAGADDYITKPFDIEELSARVRGLLRIKGLQDELRAANERLAEMSVTDGLTGLYNHRHLLELLAVEVNRAQRYHRPLAVIMLDVDHFKEVNDTHGHLFGDFVLRGLADIFRRAVRAGDVVGRYGGEEFAIVVTDTSGATLLAERIRQNVEKADFEFEGRRANVRISAGVCQAMSGAIDDGQELLRLADEALYCAKQAGRNRVATKSKET